MDNVTTQPTIDQQPTRRRLGGRPKLLPEERRSVRLQVGYTQHQAEQLAERADRAGLTDIELIRRLSLQQPLNTIPAANREAIVELNRLGTNLNQIAKRLNAGTLEAKSASDMNQWLEKLHAKIAELGARLTHGD